MNMEAAVAILSIALAISIGAMSPGPSFVMVARTAMASSRADGLAAALGMGGVLFACAALGGLHIVLKAAPGLYLGLKAVGGAYLLWLGWMIWRGAKAPLHITDGSPSITARRSFWMGLATQISNPKTAVV